jgi:lysine biosynthesis protein LysW
MLRASLLRERKIRWTHARIWVLYNSRLGEKHPRRSTQVAANCPECGSLIDIDEDEVAEGELLSCPECQVELEVVNTQPLELDVTGEDGDEEEDEEEEDEEEESEEEFDEDEDSEEDYEEEENGLY